MIKPSATRLEKLLPVLTILGALGLCVWYGLRYWQWQQSLQFEPAQPRLSPKQSAEEPPAVNRSQLYALFGKAEKEEVPLVPEVKESTLSLKLLASYVAAGDGRSAAVISSNDKDERLFYPGDKIQPGVELVGVQGRRVLIKRNGVLESVSLVEREQGAGETARSSQVTRKPASPVAQTPAVAAPRAAAVSQESLAERLSRLRALTHGEK